jgi:hypothetical protein
MVEPEQRADVQYVRPLQGLSTGDLAEFGAALRDMGMTALEARGLNGDLQQIASQAVMAGTTRVLERLRTIQQAQLAEMVARIRMLPSPMGYVNRDVVLSVIMTVLNQTPGSMR